MRVFYHNGMENASYFLHVHVLHSFVFSSNTFVVVYWPYFKGLSQLYDYIHVHVTMVRRTYMCMYCIVLNIIAFADVFTVKSIIHHHLVEFG